MSLDASTIAAIKKAISDGEYQIKELEPEINRAVSAGLDMTDQKAKLAELKIKVSKLKSQYGNL